MSGAHSPWYQAGTIQSAALKYLRRPSVSKSVGGCVEKHSLSWEKQPVFLAFYLFGRERDSKAMTATLWPWTEGKKPQRFRSWSLYCQVEHAVTQDIISFDPQNSKVSKEKIFFPLHRFYDLPNRTYLENGSTRSSRLQILFLPENISHFLMSFTDHVKSCS